MSSVALLTLLLSPGRLFGQGSKLSSATPPVAPQAAMQSLAMKLGFGAARSDSPVPQPTKSGFGAGRAGYYQCFERGCVYSSPDTGVRAVYGSLFNRFVREGAERGTLGLPTSNEAPCSNPASGFKYQTFEGGRLLWKAADNTTARTPSPAPGGASNCTGNYLYEAVTTTQSAELVPAVTVSAAPVGPNQASPVYTPPPSGRFRVTLNGFLVVHETADHSMEVDGKRDEVFILAEAAEFNAAGEILNRTSPESAVLGDIQGYGARIPAGRASDLGGLRSSDPFPTSEPWRRSGAVSGRRPPMLLWEGTLTQGSRGVIIVPTIWEWDGPTDVLRQYRAGMASVFARYVRTLNASETSFDRFLAPMTGGPGSARVVGFEPTGNAADRPIGVNVRTGSFLSASEQQQGLEWFTPQRLVLTYDLARQAVTNTRDGFGPGVFRITYTDHPELAGVYALFVQVERID
jgi:hypothetical protein